MSDTDADQSSAAEGPTHRETEAETVPGHERVLHLDARSIRGMAHPLRIKIIGHLRTHGSTTATKLANALGVNTGATSYHLRQLAEYGYVVEDPERGVGRERWWKAAHTATHVDKQEFGASSADPDAGEAYLRVVAQIYAERMQHFIDVHALMEEQWLGNATMSDYTLSLTSDETAELRSKIFDLLATYRRHDPEQPDDRDEAEPVSVQLQIIPLVDTSDE